jgi:hypothetical protein
MARSGGESDRGAREGPLACAMNAPAAPSA